MIIAFDTETTGLIENHTVKIEKQPEIIEFYACSFDPNTGKVFKELNTFLKPTHSISDEITGITGITNEMVKKAPSYKEMATKILSFLIAYPTLTGHNLAFDKEMIDIENERLGLPPLRTSKLLCTVEQTVHLKGIRLSLSNLHNYLFGEPFEGAHRAKVDVLAQVRCFTELRKRGEI